MARERTQELREKERVWSARYHAANREARLAAQRAEYAENPDKDRDRHLRKKYGITLEQYNRLLAKQNGKCAICGGPPTGRSSRDGQKRFHLDHCHKTKRVRGLLCHHCNHSLGGFKEDPSVLARAIQYLVAPPEEN